MDNTTFFKLIFWGMVGPFYLAWKLIVLVYHLVFKPLNQTIADKRADSHQQKVDSEQELRKQQREADRQKQIEALQASLPPTLPDKMRATIQINTVKAPTYTQQRISHLIADDSFVTVEGEEVDAYAVDVIVELTETERALLREHSLLDLVLEELPQYTEDELERFERELTERGTAFKADGQAELWSETTNDMLKQRKAMKDEVRVGDYLMCPYSRVFPAAHDAHQYAQKLKTKILPQIKALLDQYQDFKHTATIEF